MKTMPKYSQEETKRNLEIVKEKKAGNSYNVLALKYKVSPQRIRQIVLRAEENTKAEKDN